MLELACGHGHYTLALADQYKDKNFIGVDKKGDRIWNGAKTALDRGYSNVAFVRCLIEKLGQYFDKDEVDEIWITFPDPFSKPSKAGKRLTSPRFMEIYRKILKDGGLVHFKSDDEPLFRYSMDIVQAEKALIEEVIEDLHDQNCIADREHGGFDPLRDICTFYEKKFIDKGKEIFYFRWRF